MSELANTIDRLEQWADYWEPHQVPELIADLRVLIGAAKAIQRALQVLQSVDRKSTEFGVVDHAVEILQEGQQ